MVTSRRRKVFSQNGHLAAKGGQNQASIVHLILLSVPAASSQSGTGPRRVEDSAEFFCVEAQRGWFKAL
eukprot:988207-Amphidinium_carterae.1